MIRNLINLPFELKLWGLYLILFPIYLMPSGQPQIADFLLIAIIGIITLLGTVFIKRYYAGILRPLLFMVLYIFLVNLITEIINSGIEAPGLSPIYIVLFYIYNLLAILLAFNLHTRFKKLFIKSTMVAIFLSAVTVILLAPFFTNSYYSMVRLTLTFNNPNQTGYFALSALTIFLVGSRAIKTSWIFTLGMTLLCLYITAVSVSKAAIYSVIILYALSLVEGILVNPRRLGFTLIIISIVFAVALNTGMGQRFISNYQYRNTVHQKDGLTELEYRGYDRMFNHPEYLILGAGEGYFHRFNTFLKKHEMHSSYGTLLFSYGIPGFFLFIVLLYRLIRHLRWNDAIFIVPILAYGLTHMGLRFTLFWIALAMFGVLGYHRMQEKTEIKSLST